MPLIKSNSKCLIILLIMQSAICSADAGNKTVTPPNILWIVAEDMSSKIASFGDPVAYTPNLDKLAKQGVRYTNVYTTAGVCAPSRSSLITGVHQNTLGTQHMRTSLFNGRVSGGGPIAYTAVPPPEVKAFPELLRAANYCTVNVAKTDYQFGDPFSIWTHQVSSSSFSDWRNCTESKQNKEQAFFTYVNLTTTHESALWPLDTLPKTLSEFGFRFVNLLKLWERVDIVKPEDVEVPPYLPDTLTVREDIARQYNNIALMDKHVGKILEKLKKDKLLNNTIIVFTTDHGDGLPRAKRSLYNSGIKVPMIIRWPEQLHANTEDESLISFVDLAPTMLDLAQIPIPDYIQGKSFVNESFNRQYAFAARDRMDSIVDRVRSVNDLEYKLIVNYLQLQPFNESNAFRDTLPSMREMKKLNKDGTLKGIPEHLFAHKRPNMELYHLQNDPHEIHNLAQDKRHAQTKQELKAVLEHWIENINDQGFQDESAMVEDMWPNLQQPITSPPDIQIKTDEITGRKKIILHSNTEGASIAYRLNKEKNWSIYTNAISLDALQEPIYFIESKAVRYGYKESRIEKVSFKNNL